MKIQTNPFLADINEYFKENGVAVGATAVGVKKILGNNDKDKDSNKKDILSDEKPGKGLKKRK